jgi:hypothetical protein
MLTTLRGRLLQTIVLATGSSLAAAHAAALTPRSAVFPPQDSQESQKAKPADQRVSGTVVDRDGNAVDRAEVQFAGPKTATVLTDGKGHFSFSGPPGDYTITVRAGERSQSFDRTIKDGQLKPDGTLVIEPEEGRS